MRETVGPGPVRPEEARPAEGRVPEQQPRRAIGPRGGCGHTEDGPTLRPRDLHDLRGLPAPGTLAYPADDLLVVSGLPGSGKSTLMSRCSTAPVIDSQYSREHWAARLPAALPYALYRPLVRAHHYLRLRRALLAGGPLVVHDCGTLPWVRSWLSRTAAAQGRRLHLLVLDSTPQQARQGQLDRGRRVSAYAFTRHRRATTRLHAALHGGPLPGCASTVVLSRPGALDLERITFTG